MGFASIGVGEIEKTWSPRWASARFGVDSGWVGGLGWENSLKLSKH